jgi:hypothetical protein
VNTKYLPVPVLIFYLVMQCVGFAQVRIVNLRKSDFFNYKGSYGDIKRALKYGVKIFFCSSIIIFRHKYTMSSYCSEDASEDIHSYIPESINVTIADALLKEPFPRLIASIDYMNYLNTI